MKYQCTKCKSINHLSSEQKSTDYLCHHCETRLPATSVDASGDTSAMFGMVGGAIFGASIAGPVGAVIGGVVGTALGKNAKGLG